MPAPHSQTATVTCAAPRKGPAAGAASGKRQAAGGRDHASPCQRTPLPDTSLSGRVSIFVIGRPCDQFPASNTPPSALVAHVSHRCSPTREPIHRNIAHRPRWAREIASGAGRWQVAPLQLASAEIRRSRRALGSRLREGLSGDQSRLSSSEHGVLMRSTDAGQDVAFARAQISTTWHGRGQ